MAKSIQALVTPEVIKWARELDCITIEEIAHKLKVSTNKVSAWESGAEYPTYNQAKLLAKHYRVPFAYFYLPNTPQKTKRLDKIDYRTFGNVGVSFMSRELRWLLRDIEDRRDTMMDLYAENDLQPYPLIKKTDKSTPVLEIAKKIRELLQLNNKVQSKFRNSNTALHYCISKLEEKDFLVFQATKIEPLEMRGLSIAYDSFPIIVINRKDEYSARLFTLVHELVHILTKTSGICNDIGQNQVSQKDIELLCNKVAGCVLVPEEDLRQNKYFLHLQQTSFNDNDIIALSRDFGVSKEVIINRLWSLDVISQILYFETLKRYTDEYLSYKKNKKQSGFVQPAIDKGTQVGKLFARTVLSAYHADKITPREASNYLLGLKIHHFDKVERWCY